MSAISQKFLRTITLAELLPLVFFQNAIAGPTNQKLQKLEEADQSDRVSGSNNIDWNVISKRDAIRREYLMEILKSWDVRSADDYLNAAIIFQHGETVGDIEPELALATTASRIDDTNKDARLLTVQAMDRILVKRGKPQWYGTQFFKNTSTGKWEMYSTDLTIATEAQREAMGLPTIGDTKSHLDAMNIKH